MKYGIILKIKQASISFWMISFKAVEKNIITMTNSHPRISGKINFQNLKI